MKSHTSENKRIIKNASIMYLRMFFSILVSLYTSRITLELLGVEDFGIYNVVGGIVVMFSFLNSSMSGATSRFLSFAMGSNPINFEKLNTTFSNLFTSHILISIIVFILSETIGLWFLENKLNISENRMFVAHILYQLSVLMTVLSILSVPYCASIIASEHISTYAYISIINILLKLFGVCLLTFLTSTDSLLLYGVIMCILEG